MRRLLAVVVLLVVSASCTDGRSARPNHLAPSPAVGRRASGLAFVAEVPWSGVPDIFVLDALVGQRDLTRSDSLESSVTWAVDGSRLAFVRYDVSPAGSAALHVMNADGTGDRVLRRCDSSMCPFSGLALSPDGRQLAMAQDGKVAVMDVDTGRTREICGLRCGWGLADIAWSPDGRRIAFSNGGLGARAIGYFASRVTPPSSIYVATADGGSVRKLTGFGCQATDPPVGECPNADKVPAWSPDGRTIAFSRGLAGLNPDPAGWLMAVPSSGGRTRTLEACVGSCTPARWSPDGRTIAYETLRDGVPSIRYVRSNGTGASFLPVCTERRCAGIDAFAWAPDSEHVALALRMGRVTAAFTIRPDGTELRRVSGSLLSYEGFAWLGTPGARSPPPSPWTPPPSPPRAPLLPGLIAFETGAGGSHIEVMRSDGGDRHRLGHNYSFDPAWLPGGTRLALRGIRRWLPRSAVFTVEVSGRNERPITWLAQLQVLHPTWSPDGRRVAFAHRRRGQSRASLWIANADGTGARPIGPAAGVSSPAWSPDGSMIAFLADAGAGRSLFVIYPDGSGLQQVTPLRGVEDGPVWVPDASALAFRWPSEGGRVVLVRPDGTGQHELPGSSVIQGPVSFSPDGSRVVFLSRGMPGVAGYGVYTMQTDGIGLARVFPCSTRCGDPVWQPITPR